MAKRTLLRKRQTKNARHTRENKREERKAQTQRARQGRWAKKTATQPNPNAEIALQDEAGPSTSAASTEEAMEPPPPTPGPVPTPEMDEEILEFGFSLPSTSVTPIGDLVPFSTTPTAPMDTGETTPPPLAIDERSERIEQLEKQLKDRDDTIKFLREQVRNREALISDLRRQLDEHMVPPMAPPTTSKNFCGSLWEQIGRIDAIDGRKVKWFLGGDLCFLWAIIGHCGSAMTAFPSPVCDCRREHLISSAKCQLRSVQELERQADQFQQLTQGGDKATAEARALTMGIVCAPLLPSINFEQMLLAPFHVFQGLGNALIKELETGENAEIAQQFFRRIGARREAFRKRDMTGNSIRKILVHADQMEALFETEWAKTICQTMAHLGKIQIFTKAQPLSPGDLDGLETAVYQFKAFLNQQPMVQNLLSKKTKAHLLLHHFVQFARQHQFLGLLDEQEDEALHSVWRRLEQLWKTMPDDEQMRQQLEYHFVSNWLLDTGRLDELKLREEEQREQAEEDKTNEESDQEADVDVVY